MSDFIERMERVGEVREYVCDSPTCQWCERGFPAKNMGEEGFIHRVRDEVAVRYLPEKAVVYREDADR